MIEPPCTVKIYSSFRRGYAKKKSWPAMPSLWQETHYKRWKRHGHVEDTRPLDWGSRETHPLYSQWCWTGRVQQPRDVLWDDFYRFLNDVGVRPSKTHRLARLDITQGFGPGNWYWKEQIVVDKTILDKKAAYQRSWRERNSVKAKGYDLKRHFGVSLEDYQNMLEKQGLLCAICLQPESVTNKNGKSRSLAVDHCHSTGRVRGLLCTNCNKALGHFKDNIDLLARATEYLRSGA